MKLDELARASLACEGVELDRRDQSRASDARLSPEMYDALSVSQDGDSLIDARTVAAYPSAVTRHDLKVLVDRLAERELIRAAGEVHAEHGVARDMASSLDEAPRIEGAAEGRDVYGRWARCLYADPVAYDAIRDFCVEDELVAQAMGDERFADKIEGRLRQSAVRGSARSMLEDVMRETGAAETLAAETKAAYVDDARRAALDKVSEYAREAADTGEYESFLSEARSVLFGEESVAVRCAKGTSVEDFVAGRAGVDDDEVTPVAQTHGASAGFELDC